MSKDDQMREHFKKEREKFAEHYKKEIEDKGGDILGKSRTLDLQSAFSELYVKQVHVDIKLNYTLDMLAELLSEKRGSDKQEMLDKIHNNIKEEATESLKDFMDS